MADYTLDDLSAITEPAADDLAHVRNTSGFDKKITWDNLRAGVVSYQEKTGNFTTVESAVTTNKVQAFQNVSSASITMTLGTSGKIIVMAPGVTLFVVYNGTTWYQIPNSNYTSFTVTTAGWFTIFRTKKNFNGQIKLSGYADNLKDYITFSVYGHEDTGDHDITVLEQSRKGSVAGITQARWGDAGAGNGMCLQLYVDPDTDTSVIINAEMIGGRVADSIGNDAGYVFGPHTSIAQDFDGNTVSTFRTYYRAALPELIRSNPYRMACHPDVVVDGAVVTRIGPGVYNSIHFTGNGTIESGKYIVLGDFTIDNGITVNVGYMELIATGSDSGRDVRDYPWTGISPCSDNLGTSDIKPKGFGGGGDGGRAGTAIYGGGAGPCGRAHWNRPGSYKEAPGYIFLNVIGKIDIDGYLYAIGNSGAGYSSGPGGGLIVMRGLDTVVNLDSFDCGGYSSGNANYGDGGGGVIEIYEFGNTAISLTIVTKGGTRGVPTDGSVFHINLINQPEKTAAGGSDVVTNNEYINAGLCLKMAGGWWF